jgi:hypothetical protein
VLRGIAVLALAATAVITASVVGARYRQDAVAGAFLAYLLLMQAVLAVGVLTRARADRLTIGFSLATVALWGFTRTVGSPLGSPAWQPEPVGTREVLATLLQLAAAAALVPMVFRSGRRLAQAGLLVLVAAGAAGGTAFALQAPQATSNQLGVIPTHQAHGADRTDAALPPPAPSGEFTVAETRQAALCAARLAGRPEDDRPGAELTVVAKDLCFDRAQIVLPANRDVVVHLVNAEPVRSAPPDAGLTGDASRAHTLSIYAYATQPVEHYPMLLGTPVAPGQSIDLRFRTSGPGSYFFQCDIHREMRGVVIVR